MARQGVNSPLTSSAGRLFDSVAAILGFRGTVSYEGQAAIELEQLADPGERGAYHAAIATAADQAAGQAAGPAGPAVDRTADPAGPFRVQGGDLVRAAVDDLLAGTPREIIAARFHNGIAALVEAGCLLLRDRHGLNTVALSGGVFQNMLLLRQATGRLEALGFRVLVHSRVPCNDGGISLGQAVVAAARDRLD
jgi:hydrogenase maturation protein HypF